jgi:hypothetical protein
MGNVEEVDKSLDYLFSWLKRRFQKTHCKHIVEQRHCARFAEGINQLSHI